MFYAAINYGTMFKASFRWYDYLACGRLFLFLKKHYLQIRLKSLVFYVYLGDVYGFCVNLCLGSGANII